MQDNSGFEMPSRCHHDYFEASQEFLYRESRFERWALIAPEAGQFRYEMASESGEASVGDVICVAPGELFRRHVLSPTLSYHVLYWPTVPLQERLGIEWAPGKWTAGDSVRLMSDFAILRRLHYRLDRFSVQRRETVAQDIVQLLWETRYELPPSADPLMAEAAQLLREKAATELSMKEVASRMGLGAVQFTRRFRAAHGATPIVFLTAHRLQMVQQLLIETDLTLDAIAARCGWSHGSYLSRVFTEHFGVAPGEFRKLRRL